MCLPHLMLIVFYICRPMFIEGLKFNICVLFFCLYYIRFSVLYDSFFLFIVILFLDLVLSCVVA